MIDDTRLCVARETVYDRKETAHEPQFVLAGRSAMVGIGAAVAEKSKRCKAQSGSADHQRHHSCTAIGLALAGWSAGLRSGQDDLQSFPPLGEKRPVGSNFS
jgi:hypothetical protein